MGQCHEICCFWFFHESVSTQPQSIPLGPFRFFSKIRRDIRKSRWTTGINDTGGKIPTGINDTGGKFATVINDGRKSFATSFTSVVGTVPLNFPALTQPFFGEVLKNRVEIPLMLSQP